MRFSKLSTFAPQLLSLLRIVSASTFITHGTQKLFGMPVVQARDPVMLWSQIGLAGVLEAFGRLLLLLGVFTRPVALLLSGEMAVAYLQVHAPRHHWPILNGGELSVLYCFIWLYIFAAGPGPWSVDALLKRRPESSRPPGK